MSSRRALTPVLAAMLLAAVAACDNGSSGADSAKVKALEDRITKLEGSNPATVPALEQRIAKLEADEKKYRDMLAGIKTQWDRQAAQQAEEEANEPAEDAVFAVDIKGNQIEGPASGAYVTIIEAWDFA